MLRLKEFAPRFQGDKTRHMLVAILDERRMSDRRLISLLKWFDFTRKGELSGGAEVWSTKATLQRPDDAILVLSSQGGLNLDRNDGVIRGIVSRLEARGAKGDLDAINRMVVHVETREVFPSGQRGRPVFWVDPGEGVRMDPDLAEERAATLANCGFLRIPGALRWRQGYYTVDPMQANALRPYMDAPAAAAWGSAMTQAREAKATSAGILSKEDARMVMAQAGLADDAPGELAGYQGFGATRAAQLDEIMIADEMGLGKTVQGIAAARLRGARNILVVAQANNKINWKREWFAWTGERGDYIDVAEGGFLPKTPIVIINQDILERHAPALAERRFDYLIVDELQNFSNPDAKRTMALAGPAPDYETVRFERGGLLALADAFCFLSGTPTPNGPRNFWGIGRLIDPVRWGTRAQDRTAFEDRYCDPAFFETHPPKGPKKIVRSITKNARRLDEMRVALESTVMVRRVKSDPRVAMDLPPKRRTVYEIPLKLTKEMLAALADMKDESDRNVEKLADLGRMGADAYHGDIGEQDRTIVSRETAHAGYEEAARLKRSELRIPFEERSRVMANFGRVKAPIVAQAMMDDLIDTDDKIMVFCAHLDAMRLVEEVAKARFAKADVDREGGPRQVVVYHGGLSTNARQKAVDGFQNDPNIKVIIGTTAMATGIKLTAACRVEMVEFDDRPDQMLQIEDRPYRFGQKASLLVRFWAAAESPEVDTARNVVAKLKNIEKSIGAKMATEIPLDDAQFHDGARDSVDEDERAAREADGAPVPV